eukprot:scaffold7963_cov115-Skeletonema_dohrnii-CCMP3373.AAC.1
MPPNTSFKKEMLTLPPGPLDVTVTVETSSSGRRCVVREKLSNQSKLAVGDKIVSVNVISFGRMAKVEDGVRAWMQLLLQENYERRVVVRRDTAANAVNASLKGIDTSTNQFLTEDRLAAGDMYEPSTNNTSKKSITWKDEHLLQEAASHWTVGEGKRQNSQCLEAMKSCVLSDISPTEIANHIGNASSRSGNNGQCVEFKRAQECVRRINKSLKKQQEKETNQMLSVVSRTWKAGKACPQTAECKAAIRKCLLAGIPNDLLASHVAKKFNEEDQARELKRVEGCMKRIEIKWPRTRESKDMINPLKASSNSYGGKTKVLQ